MIFENKWTMVCLTKRKKTQIHLIKNETGEATTNVKD